MIKNAFVIKEYSEKRKQKLYKKVLKRLVRSMNRRIFFASRRGNSNAFLSREFCLELNDRNFVHKFKEYYENKNYEVFVERYSYHPDYENYWDICVSWEERKEKEE